MSPHLHISPTQPPALPCPTRLNSSLESHTPRIPHSPHLPSHCSAQLIALTAAVGACFFCLCCHKGSALFQKRQRYPPRGRRLSRRPTGASKLPMEELDEGIGMDGERALVRSARHRGGYVGGQGACLGGAKLLVRAHYDTVAHQWPTAHSAATIAHSAATIAHSASAAASAAALLLPCYCPAAALLLPCCCPAAPETAPHMLRVPYTTRHMFTCVLHRHVCSHWHHTRMHSHTYSMLTFGITHVCTSIRMLTFGIWGGIRP